MAGPFGDERGGQTSPTNSDFERSVPRPAGYEDDASSRLREAVNEDVGAVQQAAENAAQTVSDKAAAAAERQKGFAADQIGKFARALEKVGDEMQAERPDAFGDYTKRLGTTARRFAERVQDKDLGEIAAIAEDFGRRQPLAFLGTAAILGLAASRFLMASRPSGVTSAATASSDAQTKEVYHG